MAGGKEQAAAEFAAFRAFAPKWTLSTTQRFWSRYFTPQFFDRMRHYPNLRKGQSDTIVELIKSLVGFICTDDHLSGIYAGHQAIDEAYMKRILAMGPNSAPI